MKYANWKSYDALVILIASCSFALPTSAFADRIDPTIVGGAVAPRSAWPWQIELQHQGSFICGGSLINENWVVTAAHCVTTGRGTTWTPTPVAHLRIRAGHNLRSAPGGDVQVFDVASVRVHPDYDAGELLNDIALLRLSTSATFTDAVKPIRRATAASVPGERAVSTGWGRTSGSAPVSDALLQAVLPIEASDECSDHFSTIWGTPGFALADSMLCAGAAAGEVGICKGDSGGPLVVAKADGSGGWELAGVSSWVSGRPVLCGSYSVFTSVSDFAGWIDGVAGGTPVLGDIDGNGCVDAADVDALFVVYGSPPPSPSYDVNTDGVVDYSDYLAVLENWGTCL